VLPNVRTLEHVTIIGQRPPYTGSLVGQQTNMLLRKLWTFYKTGPYCLNFLYRYKNQRLVRLWNESGRKNVSNSGNDERVPFHETAEESIPRTAITENSPQWPGKSLELLSSLRNLLLRIRNKSYDNCQQDTAGETCTSPECIQSTTASFCERQFNNEKYEYLPESWQIEN
jgi:hypothetical protein